MVAGSAPTATATRRCSRYARRGRRVWAIEGCQGIGRHVALRLLADGEQVVDVPPKLSARARVFATGQGRKTDATDAHSVALVGTRMAGLRPVVNDEQLAVLRILVDRRRSLGEDHTRMIVPAAPAAAGADPRRREEGPVRRPGQGAAGQGPAPRRRRQDPTPGRRRADRRPRADLRSARRPPTRNSPQLVAATGTTLMDLHGIGPSGAARLLVEVGDITRFPNRDHFASWNGTAPIDASSGDQVRHRLSRAGNRQINRVLHIMAIVQLRNPTEGRAYYDRTQSRRQDLDGSDARTQTTTLRHRLPAHGRRRQRPGQDGPGRATGRL